MNRCFFESPKYLSLVFSRSDLWLWRCGTIDSDAGPAGDLCQLCMSVRDETNYLLTLFFFFFFYMLMILYCYVVGLVKLPLQHRAH